MVLNSDRNILQTKSNSQNHSKKKRSPFYSFQVRAIANFKQNEIEFCTIKRKAPTFWEQWSFAIRVLVAGLGRVIVRSHYRTLD